MTNADKVIMGAIVTGCLIAGYQVATDPPQESAWLAAEDAEIEQMATDRGMRTYHSFAHTNCDFCKRPNHGKSKDHLEVHHYGTKENHPELINVETNVCTLCRVAGKGCHWYIGHGGRNTKYENPLAKKIVEECGWRKQEEAQK